MTVPEAVSVGYTGDATHEEHSNNSDDPSRREYIAALDTNFSAPQIASAASTGPTPIPSVAQQFAACYRAAHDGHAPEFGTTQSMEKGHPPILDDQCSMYSLATSMDIQSTMDMMWRPKPKIHMCRSDQRALIHAQSQAIAMMHDAGLKPSNKIQCRRRGCADILSGVEALKYHLHVHNIADTAARRNDAPPSVAYKPSLVQCSTSNSRTPKRSHSRSKSSLGTQQSCPTAYSPPRKLSASGILPSIFSPRGGTPKVQHVPNLTTASMALVPDPSSSQPAAPLRVGSEKTPSTHTPTRSCGRRTRRESKAISVGATRSPSIAMPLSPPPSSDMQRHFVTTPHTNLIAPSALNPALEGKSDDCSAENVHPVSEKLARSRSPLKALSPIRAMSPIRNGIRRVLSIGYPVNLTDE